MAMLVCAGAAMQCSLGTAPTVLKVLPASNALTGLPAATIADMKPLDNIASFGMCTSPANPVVASATAAASGVLTPMPCVPATASPWTPGLPLVTIGVVPALDLKSTLACTWGGVIKITSPGQGQASGA